MGKPEKLRKDTSNNETFATGADALARHPKNRKTLHFLIAFTIISLLIFASKLILLLNPISGEEGMFAYMLMHKVDSEKSLLIGALEGELIFTAPEHPSLMYAYINELRGIQAFLASNFANSTVSLRGVAFFSQIILVGGLLIAARNNTLSRIVWILVVTGIASLQIFRDPSFTLQTDTLFGQTVFAVCGILVVLANDKLKNVKNSSALFLIFCAGLVLSFGKQEWVFASAMALAASYLLSIRDARISATHKHQVKQFSVVFAIGLVGGSALSFFADPTNYLAGFDVIWRTMFSNGLTIEDRALRLLYFGSQKIILIAPILFLVVSAQLPGRASNLKLDYLQVLLLNLALFNMLPGLVSTWNADPRYLVPGATIGAIAATSVLVNSESSRKRFVLLTVAVIGIISLVGGILRFGVAFEGLNSSSTTNQLENHDCVAVIPSSEAYKSASAYDWISSDLGEAGAKNLMAQYGVDKPFCS